MAVTTDPKIVHSCCVSTANPSMSEKKYFMSVPYGDKYLQAYVLDENLLVHVLTLLKKMDPTFIDDRETLEERKEKENTDVKNEKEEKNDFNNDFKWFRNLENWSYI